MNYANQHGADKKCEQTNAFIHAKSLLKMQRFVDDPNAEQCQA